MYSLAKVLIEIFFDLSSESIVSHNFGPQNFKDVSPQLLWVSGIKKSRCLGCRGRMNILFKFSGSELLRALNMNLASSNLKMSCSTRILQLLNSSMLLILPKSSSSLYLKKGFKAPWRVMRRTTRRCSTFNLCKAVLLAEPQARIAYCK